MFSIFKVCLAPKGLNTLRSSAAGVIDLNRNSEAIGDPLMDPPSAPMAGLSGPKNGWINSVSDSWSALRR